MCTCTHQKAALLDATSEQESGKEVFIKRIDFRTHPDEFKIALRLGSSESLKDKRNHSVPVLNSFSDDWVPEYRYIVMPVLRPFNDPDFTSFGEVFDFVSQTLEVRLHVVTEGCDLNATRRVSYICTIKTWHTGG